MKRGFVDLPEGQMHYRTEGAGEPLLLLHMTQASSLHFVQLIPLLSQHYWVLAPDLPGYGDSDPAPRQYTMADYAQSVLGFMDALGVRRASLIGDTTGGDVAVEIAATHPERVDKLVLNNQPYWKYDENRLREFEHYPQVPLQDDGSHLLRIWQGVARQLEGAPLEDIQRRVVLRLQNQLSPKHGEESHFAVFTYKSQARFPLVQSPTLVFTIPSGSFHRRQPDVVNTLPRGKLMELPDVPPNFLYFKPHLFAAAVLPFLEDPGV